MSSSRFLLDLRASCGLATFSGQPIETMSSVGGNTFVREDAPWLRGGPDVQYMYEQRVSFLCAGLDGPGRSFLEAKWPVRAVNVIDMKPYLRVPVDRLHGAGILQNGGVNTCRTGALCVRRK